MSEVKKENEHQLNIEIDEKVADGVYSNLAIINHSSSEFVVDFVNIMPGAPKAKVKSRVILTPQHAKQLVRALTENIQRFEKNFGVVKEADQNNTFPLFGLKGEA